MDWLESIRDAVIANLATTLVLTVVGGIVLGILGALKFGPNYKQRIASLEARPSQPIEINNINNIYTGERSAPNIMGDVTEIKTLTQAQYDAISNKSDSTLYLIVDKR